MKINYRHINAFILENNENLPSQMKDIIEGLEIAIIKTQIHNEADTLLKELGRNENEIVIINLASDSDISFAKTQLEKITTPFPEAPVLITNGPLDLNTAYEFISDGAEDYISRVDIGEKRLNAAVLYAMSRRKRHTEKVQISVERQHSLKRESLGTLARTTADQMNEPLKRIQAQIEGMRSPSNLPPQEQLGQLHDAIQTTYLKLKDLVYDLNKFHSDLAEDISDHRKLRILVADDEEIYLELIASRLLKTKNCEVDRAHDGAEAYEMCIKSLQNGHRYDLIIADIGMPNVSGIDLLKQLRSNSYFANTPFMMVTGNKDHKTVLEAAHLNVSQYLIKPFDGKDFDQRISRLSLIL